MKALNTALSAMRRSPYQSILSIFVLSITLFITYCFSLLTMGSAKILSFFETQPQVIAFLKLEAKADDLEEVRAQISAKPYVTEVKVITQEQALEIYRQENQGDPLLLELVTADILPASVEVAAADAASLDNIKRDLEGMSAVEDVALQEDVVDNLVRWTNALRLIGVFLLGVMLLTSFLMVTSNISMKVAAKKRSIQVMRFVGASNAYIARPYLLEALILSMISATLAFACYYALLLYLQPWLSGFLTGIVTFPIAWQLLAYQYGAGLAVAIILGLVASQTAVWRMLKR